MEVGREIRLDSDIEPDVKWRNILNCIDMGLAQGKDWCTLHLDKPCRHYIPSQSDTQLEIIKIV